MTALRNRGRLFRDMQREYGRCVSRVYVDGKVPVNGDPALGYTYEPRPVGWVFQKRVEYDDARPSDPERTYLREVWVEVREVEDDACAG